MAREWVNWSGSMRFTPGEVARPADEEELSGLVRRAAAEGRTVRAVGAGHSSSRLVATDDVLVSLENLKGVEEHSQDQATLRTGMTVREAGEALRDLGLSMHNVGDVDVQTLVGAISTGTHGTGHQLQNLSSMLMGMRMVNARGEIVEYSLNEDDELRRAARVSLGTLGIFTAIRVKLLPAFKLRRQEWCTHIDTCMEHLDELVESNRNFDFYWYPRNDLSKLRTWNEDGKEPEDVPYATLVEDYSGWSYETLPKERDIKFEEIEFSLPAEAGPACMQEVRKRVKESWRKEAGWRVLYRTIAGDDAYLSPASGRQTVSISIHHNSGLPFEAYFRDMQAIFRAYDGRPHWGKKHWLRAQELANLYPHWDDFQAVRRRMDPDGVFMNDYLRELLGEPLPEQAGGRA